MTQPKLTDAKGIMNEWGFKRHLAEALMRECEPKVKIGRRIFVYRADVEKAIKAREQPSGRAA